LLAEAAYLLGDWPHQFLESIQSVGLRGSFVLEQRARQLPFWLLSGIQDPLCRLKFPSAQGFQILESSNIRTFRERIPRTRSTTFEKIAFIQEHPEWHEDIPQLARAMVEFGLFAPEHPIASIQKTCRSYLLLITRHVARKSASSSQIAITGFRAKLVAQQRFLRAFKRVLARRIGI